MCVMIFPHLQTAHVHGSSHVILDIMISQHGDVLVKESLTDMVELSGLTKGKDYHLSVVTVSILYTVNALTW